VLDSDLHLRSVDFVFFDSFESLSLSVLGGGDTQGLDVTVLGTSLLGLPANPPPNTTLVLPGNTGVLVLNERTVSGDGVTGRGVSTNAVHLTLDALGLIVGDVVIAHSDAAIACH